jgi:cytidylate kinase
MFLRVFFKLKKGMKRMNNKVIGIEGLVGSGKTSICRELINKMPNSIILHGGNLYRGIVYATMMNNSDISNLKDADILEIMEKLNVEIKLENNETVVYVNNKKIDENELQNEKTSMAVSIASNIANNENLFVFARNIINNFKEKYNVIVSGRALMEIYPDLDYHFFITASLDERVKRKAMQYEQSVNLEELKEHIEKRDEIQEKSGFYKIYPNTINVDVTECKNVEESTEKVMHWGRFFL